MKTEENRSEIELDTYNSDSKQNESNETPNQTEVEQISDITSHNSNLAPNQTTPNQTRSGEDKPKTEGILDVANSDQENVVKGMFYSFEYFQ